MGNQLVDAARGTLLMAFVGVTLVLIGQAAVQQGNLTGFYDLSAIPKVWIAIMVILGAGVVRLFWDSSM